MRFIDEMREAADQLVIPDEVKEQCKRDMLAVAAKHQMTFNAQAVLQLTLASWPKPSTTVPEGRLVMEGLRVWLICEGFGIKGNYVPPHCRQVPEKFDGFIAIW